MSLAITPADLTIRPRDISFSREAPAGRWWLGADPVATAFYNALSVTFPQGERFFMDSVRRFRDEAPPELQAQITAFITQEAMHTREHVFFNRQVAEHGFDVKAMETRTRKAMDFARRHAPLQQLAATTALEHFTAILAHWLLADPRHLHGASAEASAMWRWHAIEEIEHKAVAFDTFVAAAAKLPAWRRWALRASTMGVATWLLVTTVGGNMGDIFATDRLSGPRTWRRVFAFLLWRPGLLRQILGEYFAYFRPGFHPWTHDDRALIARAENDLRANYGSHPPALA